MIRITSHSRAFTLTEIIIALGMLMAVLASMFTYLNNLIDSRNAIREHSQKERAAATLIDRLETDLMTCLVGDSRNGPGVSGDTTSITILSRGVAANLADRGDRDPLVFSDLQKSEYRYNESSHLLEGRRTAVSPLQRRATEPFWEIGLLPKVRFRFHDGSGWRDSFDSLAEGKLPLAVEVAIWYAPWPGDEPGGEEEDSFDDEDIAFERETFDTTPVFDERAYAEELAFDLLPPPIPDRVRVIAIIDAEGEEE